MSSLFRYLKTFFGSEQTHTEDSPSLQGIAKADALLTQLAIDCKVPGLAVTVVKEGKTIFQKGYGYASIEKKNPVCPQNTIFRIASISKPIAATALAKMVAQGIIDLDASFYTYVPYFPKKQWDFTIRQLASHTAGIRGYKGKEFGLNEPFSIKDSLAVFQEDDLLFEPGKGYVYNSFGWVLISLAMQEASGIPFENYVYNNVLGPLGMSNTVAPKKPFSDDEEKKVYLASDHENRASFYTKRSRGFKAAIPVNNFYKLAGGGYLSTAEDIAKFGQAYLDGNILTEGHISTFLTSQQVDGKATYYGLGWQVSEDKNGRKFYGHVGSSVGAYANLFVYPVQKVVFVALINCTDPKVQNELDLILECFLEPITKKRNTLQKLY